MSSCQLEQQFTWILVEIFSLAHHHVLAWAESDVKKCLIRSCR